MGVVSLDERADERRFSLSEDKDLKDKDELEMQQSRWKKHFIEILNGCASRSDS